MKAKIIFRAIFLIILVNSVAFGTDSAGGRKSFEEHIRTAVPVRKEIDVFLNEMSWARFDSDIGYILGNYMPHDGMDGSSTISTSQSDGARTQFMYKNRPCRINTYGNSFTQCHQVSDGETWQEYLAGHLGEPVRNFGMGGIGVYQAYRRMIREEKTALGAHEYVPWTYYERNRDCLDALHAQGIFVAAIEVTEDAVPYPKFDWPRPVAIVLGNEVNGVNHRVLRRCDAIVKIPMQGYKNSINVATAFGIILYDILGRWGAFPQT